MVKQWILDSQKSIESLKLQDVAVTSELGDEEVLVELQAASLNYRDLVIAKGAPGLPIKPNIVPGSDGAGIVKAVGCSVTSFKPSDKVCTHMVPFIADGDWPTFNHITAGMGEVVDGTLRESGVFHQSCLVLMPKNLSFEEAATLTCSGLTAWNALFGLKARVVERGDWVLVQGTGGVSVAALQFAIAVGATVVATTSSDQKASRLRTLGASHVIDYKTDPNWGETGKALTPDARGFDHIIDVGGNSTLAQSLKGTRIDGLITAAGLVGGAGGDDSPKLLDAMWSTCIVRGVLLGTRQQFRDMNEFIERLNINPAVDDVSFSLRDAKGAYRRLEEQNHFSKIVIRIN